MIKIVLATHNSGKVSEIKDYFAEYPVIIECLKNYPEISEIAETGKTFYENALIKAKQVTAITDLPSLGDDSGLEVDYLDGKPGIYSARWGKDDRERIDKIIKALKNASQEQRNARFVCNMAFATPDNNIYTTKGICVGRISLKPQGDSGFGYDPIFIPEGFEQTFAQLGEKIKSKISHRAIALNKIIKIILKLYKLQ
ncbi:MAG: RdgB/HAM1 family non-canonical purine NTP pyrophosphatase [Atribacterota bacterium]|nr:RdgB/HAM1 family non-canonical purine NTP pyrophosphatase [Atribacterota bacterium]MDD4288737.1 RdgB/HAM1 family non-canonical purine NTP pyrophosphatase [Atribacterota bacterium]